jgi:RNA polymerase sigma factor (sigma-70 family)
VEPIQALLELIERDRPWLAIQPRFEADWERGCRWALAEMQSLVLASAHGLLPSPIGGDLMDRSRVRVWAAWSYHWHEATRTAPDHRVDGATVADMLRRGERPGRVDAQLGGDPIRDAVLVEACLLGLPPAHNLLREAYAAVFLREARRVGVESEARSLEEEVWDRLAPIDEASRRWLERYRGYSSLRTFLRVTVRHRLLDSLRSRCTRQLAERIFSARRQAEEEPSPIAGVELDEFRAQVRQALLSLPEVEQRLLVLRYLEGLPNGVVAREIGLSDGQTSRRHGQAVEKLRDALKLRWQEDISSSEQGYSLYAQFLLRGLSEMLALQAYTGTASTAAGPKERHMSLIREIEKRKERQSTPRKAAPTRKPAARREELLAPPPIDLEGLIPDTIAVVVIGKKEPEEAFAELRAKSARAWLDKFDALVYEQEEKPVPAPVEMQVVVFLTGKQDLTHLSDFLTRSDIDWVLTEDRSSSLTKLYPEVVQKDLSELMSTDPTEGLDMDDDPDARPIEDFTPEDELDEWEQRLEELGHKDGR